MKILCFDTCFNKSYIVLGDNTQIIQSEIVESDDKNYHSAYLIPKIRDILKSNSLFIKDLDAIGVNIGPGSFTGVRASVTAARVLSQQFNTELVGISSLEILSHLNKSNTKTTVVTDARKNKVYFAQYDNNIETIPPSLIDKDDLIPLFKEDNTVIVSDNSIGTFLADNGVKTINFEEMPDNLGIFLFEAVLRKLNISDENFNWAKVKPLYIQKPSISKPKEKSNVH